MDVLKEIFDLAKSCREKNAQLAKALSECNAREAAANERAASAEAKLASVETEKQVITDELTALKAEQEAAIAADQGASQH